MVNILMPYLWGQNNTLVVNENRKKGGQSYFFKIHFFK